MAVVDLDPLFVKALKLLQSRSKESTDQLKQMLIDELANKKVKTDLTSLTAKISHKDEDERWELARASSPGRSHRQSDRDSDSSKKRDGEKRQHEKPIKSESLEPEPKKPKLEARPSPAHTPEPRPEKSKDKDRSKDRSKDSHKDRSKDSHRDKRDKDRDKDKSHRDKDRDREKREKEREREREREKEREKERMRAEVKAEVISSESENDDDNLLTMDADNFAMDMGITCIVCKQMSQSAGNQLVECQECHNLYHQECHRPPVTEQDVNDPRFVWYCSRCIKNMKKMVSKPAKQKVPPVVIPKDPVPSKPPKVETPTLLPFKRMLDPAKPSGSRESSSSSSRGQGVGLAGLAGLAAKSKMSTTSTSSCTTPTSATPDSSKGKNPFESSKHSKVDNKASLNMAAGTGLAMLANAAAASKSEKTSSSKSSKNPNLNPASKNPNLNPDKRLQMMKKKAAAKQLEKRAK